MFAVKHQRVSAADGSYICFEVSHWLGGRGIYLLAGVRVTWHMYFIIQVYWEEIKAKDSSITMM
jgi:hypothetical protein